MQKLWRRIVDEPAMVVVIVVAIANTFWSLSQDQVDALTLIIENILLIVSGGVVRQSVTPVAKLKRKGIRP